MRKVKVIDIIDKMNGCLFWLASLVIPIVIAFFVHVLFSITAPVQWLEAKWNAGEILTYISTYLLGMLAIWQNFRFKEENDDMQKRLEKLTMQANELSVVSKVIEYETRNHEKLLAAFDDFSRVCDPQTFLIGYLLEKDDEETLAISLANKENLIDNAFFTLGRILRVDPNIARNGKHPLIEAYTLYYAKAKENVKIIKGKHLLKQHINELLVARDDFMRQREEYLLQREQKLHKLIYDELSLDEIKMLYGVKTPFKKQLEKNNELRST